MAVVKIINNVVVSSGKCLQGYCSQYLTDLKLYSIIKNQKPKEEIKIDKNEYINKINNLNKEIKEKNEYINILEKEKNNENKLQVISDTANFQIKKLKELNNLLQDKCQNLKKENENLKLNNKNSNINSNKSNDEINDLKKENSEKEKKINDLNLTIESLNNEIKELKLKLLKNIELNNINCQNDNNDEIKRLNETVEKLKKEKNEINRAKLVEKTQLNIEITKLKMQNASLKNEIENYKEINAIVENNKKKN